MRKIKKLDFNLVQCMTTPKYILIDIAKNLFAGPILNDIEQMVNKIESESHRHYHNLHHGYSVFCELELDSKNRLLDFLFALCHDIVYDPKRTDNEYQSVVYISKIQTISSLSFFDELKQRIRETEKLNVVNRFTTADRQSVLLTFSQDQIEYFKAIRKEYSFVPWDRFINSHLEIFNKIRQAHGAKDNGYGQMVRDFNKIKIVIRYRQSWNPWSKKAPTLHISFKHSSNPSEFTSKKVLERMRRRYGN